MKKYFLLSFVLFYTSLLLCNCGGRRALRESTLIASDPAGIVATARSQIGKPYKYGGISPETGFDCSGFTCWVFAQHHVQLPRQSNDQFDVGRKVYIGQLMPGDLVFFEVYQKGASHVGIYSGNAKFIHSANSGGSVREERLSDRYWRSCYIGARRVFEWEK